VVISPGVGGGLVRTLTRDWQVGVIYQARSGSALTPEVDDDYQLTDNGDQRPVLVEGVDPYLPESQRVFDDNFRLAWFNMAAFAPNSPGEWGNVPKGYLRGPSFWNVDASFSRNINFSGGRRIELRIEAFNLFDHVNWANPETEINQSDSGMIDSQSGDARIMQFAVKYNF
jgi:hypothetical protein